MQTSTLILTYDSLSLQSITVKLFEMTRWIEKNAKRHNLTWVPAMSFAQ